MSFKRLHLSISTNLSVIWLILFYFSFVSRIMQTWISLAYQFFHQKSFIVFFRHSLFVFFKKLHLFLFYFFCSCLRFSLNYIQLYQGFSICQIFSTISMNFVIVFFYELDQFEDSVTTLNNVHFQSIFVSCHTIKSYFINLSDIRLLAWIRKHVENNSSSSKANQIYHFDIFEKIAKTSFRSIFKF